MIILNFYFLILFCTVANASRRTSRKYYYIKPFRIITEPDKPKAITIDSPEALRQLYPNATFAEHLKWPNGYVLVQFDLPRPEKLNIVGTTKIMSFTDSMGSGIKVNHENNLPTETESFAEQTTRMAQLNDKNSRFRGNGDLLHRQFQNNDSGIRYAESDSDGGDLRFAAEDLATRENPKQGQEVLKIAPSQIEVCYENCELEHLNKDTQSEYTENLDVRIFAAGLDHQMSIIKNENNKTIGPNPECEGFLALCYPEEMRLDTPETTVIENYRSVNREYSSQGRLYASKWHLWWDTLLESMDWYGFGSHGLGKFLGAGWPDD